MKNPIDLRSDTVTKPTPEMWEALRGLDNSMLGDDVFQEDPTVNELEFKAAELMNKEAGLLVTSGTQGNLVSLLSTTSPGEEILVEAQSHIFLNEVGSAARFGGLTSRTFHTERGNPEIYQLQQLIRSKTDIHQPWTTLLCIENTHNYHGGSVVTPQEIGKLSSFCTKNDLQFHMDGARIFNAVVASESHLVDYTNHVDTMMFCLAKGMSCPVGSLVVGSQKFIDKARKFRKMLGGGMRQAGVIAIMGLIAFEQNWKQQIKDDHINAKVIAHELTKEHSELKIIEPESNIIMVYCPDEISLPAITNDLEKENILILDLDNKLRIVTHYGISKEDVERSIESMIEVFGRHLHQ
jgi:threonine aldolase